MKGLSNAPTQKMAVLDLKNPKNGLIYYYRYLKKWDYEKVSLAKVPLKKFYLEELLLNKHFHKPIF